MTKSFSDITDADKEKVIQMYKDAKVTPETNYEMIQSIIRALDIEEWHIKRMLKEADIYVPSPTPEYQDLERATKNSRYQKGRFPTNPSYTDIHFRGTIRMFGDTDAWVDWYMNDWETPYKRRLGETFFEYQVRVELETKLDIDLERDTEDRAPYLRPFDVQTTERDDI